MRGYLQSIEVDAGPGVVWHALTQPSALALWYARGALIEPRQGGRYEVETRFFGHRSALIDVYEAARRLRVIHLPCEGWPPLHGGTIVEDFLIDRRGERTLLRLLGSGVPADPDWDAMLRRLRAGWAVAFDYLRRRLAAGEIRMVAP